MKYLIRRIKNIKFLGVFSIYMGSSLLNAAIPFLLLPIFTYYLSPSDFGEISMFSVLGGFIMPFIGFSSLGVISREYFNLDKLLFGQYLGNIFNALFVSIIPISIVLYFCSDIISKLTGLSITNIWLCMVFSLFTYLLNSILIIWQVQSKAKEYGFFQVGQTIFNIGLSLVLIIWLKLGFEGRIYSQVISAIIFGSVGFYIIKKYIGLNLKFNSSFFIDALTFGIPLIPHTLGAILISLSDRLFITNLIGIEATGLYSVGYSIGSIIGFIEHSFNLAYAPWLFNKLNLNDSLVKIKIVQFTYLYFIFILFLVLFLTLLVPFVFDNFIDKKFENAQIYVFWISLSFAFSGMYKMVTNYIFYIKKTYILAWVTFFSAIINLILNYFFIIKFGPVGVAIATALTSFIFFAFTWFISNRLFNMPWGSLKIFESFKKYHL